MDSKQKSIRDFLTSPQYLTPEKPTPVIPEGESQATPTHPQTRPEQLSPIKSNLPPIIPVINLDKAFDSTDPDRSQEAPLNNPGSQGSLAVSVDKLTKVYPEEAISDKRVLSNLDC